MRVAPREIGGDGFHPNIDGELTRRYNRIPKYVASRTLTEVGWQSSQLLGPDVETRALRSGALVNTYRRSDPG